MSAEGAVLQQSREERRLQGQRRGSEKGRLLTRRTGRLEEGWLKKSPLFDNESSDNFSGLFSLNQSIQQISTPTTPPGTTKDFPFGMLAHHSSNPRVVSRNLAEQTRHATIASKKSSSSWSQFLLNSSWLQSMN